MSQLGKSDKYVSNLEEIFDLDLLDQLTLAFDRVFYTTKYPDVVEAGFEPLEHYLQFGWREGRNPSPDFSTDYYLGANPDITDADTHPFIHYVTRGKAEGRPGVPSAEGASEIGLAPGMDFEMAAEMDAIRDSFDADFYLSQYPGVAEAGLDPLKHYVQLGWREGRNPSPDFSTDYYLGAHPDIAQADINPFMHYVTQGKAKGWSGRPAADAVTEPQLPPELVADMDAIRDSFDADFYLSQYPGVAEAGLDPLEHYVQLGWREGRDPSPDFSTRHYLEANLDVAISGVNPFVHFLTQQQTEAADVPDPEPIKAPVEIDAGASEARHEDCWAIEEDFDKEFYLSSFLLEDRPEDPVDHYLKVGWKEGRDPTPWFSSRHYLSENADVAAVGMNPFMHYCIVGKNEGRPVTKLGRQADGDVYEAHALAVAPGPDFEDFDPKIGIGRRKRAKVLAYYLPQFHPIKVNDENWGTGFTEWRNLPRAMPRFMGHIQPRIPRDLGCYDLVESDVMRSQIEMAKAAGIHGFCFYHYWFDGERVLEAPMERMLADPSLDFPFCLMWANENWTRTWDGSEKEVILGQKYREEDDIPLIDDLARHMKDPRYIRIGDRPLFFLYRPGHIPGARERMDTWRDVFRDRHGLDPLIFNAQAFGDNDPREFDLDGAIEFPPHKILSDAPDVSSSMAFFDTKYTGNVREYDAVVQVACEDPTPDFPLIRTVFPSWDNEARRPGRGTIVAHSTPDKFAEWLDWAITYSETNPIYGEPIVCINAWNEWAEGAYLEPDVHFGSAYLNTVSRVVHGTYGAEFTETASNKPKMLLVGHDTLAFGAQKLITRIGETLTRHFGYEVTFVILDSNTHGDSFETTTATMSKIGSVIFADQFEGDDAALAQSLAAQGYSAAITNTTPSGKLAPALRAAGFRIASLIHELPNLLKSYNLEHPARMIAENSDHVIFPAEIVQQGFEDIASDIANVAEIFPQGLYNTSVLDIAPGDGGLRAELGLKAKTKIILGVGFADLRKGIDRFISAGLSLCDAHDDIAFLWVGSPGGEATTWFQPEIDASGLGDRVRILGHREDIARFFAAADAFYLSSREDPFPSVVLEALACGLPVIGHEGCGGCDTLIRTHGVLVPHNNPMGITDAILSAISRRNPRAADARRAEIEQNYNFSNYVFGLAQRLAPNLPKISAVVPNYKYEDYIGARLHTVFEQTTPLYEVIVLDDCSPDGSVAEIERTAEAAGRLIDLHINETNSGSPFPQWRKGVELAKGDYIWIGEADDLADPTFVARVIDQMQQAGSVLGFTDSNQIDEHSLPMGDSYKPYVNQIEDGAFDRAFDMDGPEFLARFLAVKNVILNVSGVIFHRETLLEAFDAVGDELYTYNVAGDWRLYAEICARKDSRVSYIPDALNTHRRHRISVTHALKVEKHLAEIETMHSMIRSRIKLSEKTRALQDGHFDQCKKHLTA